MAGHIFGSPLRGLDPPAPMKGENEGLGGGLHPTGGGASKPPRKPPLKMAGVFAPIPRVPPGDHRMHGEEGVRERQKQKTKSRVPVGP